MNITLIKTTDGVFAAEFSERGLVRLEFPPTRKALRANRNNSAQSGKKFRTWQVATAKALKQALAGKSPKNLPPLDVASGTEFQRRVWAALQKISPGKARSYGELARFVGKPKAARAVGNACGANPIPVFIPCHRALAANQKLGGFSGGLDWKRTLLAREGISLA